MYIRYKIGVAAIASFGILLLVLQYEGNKVEPKTNDLGSYTIKQIVKDNNDAVAVCTPGYEFDVVDKEWINELNTGIYTIINDTVLIYDLAVNENPILITTISIDEETFYTSKVHISNNPIENEFITKHQKDIAINKLQIIIECKIMIDSLNRIL